MSTFDDNKHVGPTSNTGMSQVNRVGTLHHKYVPFNFSGRILTSVLGLGIALQIVLPGRESTVNLIAVTNPSRFCLVR